MQRVQLEWQSNFHVIAGNPRAESAVMVLPAGESTGGPGNRHTHSDQWLYVAEGSGEAIVQQRSVPLQKGTLLLIERDEPHEIRNTGEAMLKTVNFYVPPAYRTVDQGHEPARD